MKVWSNLKGNSSEIKVVNIFLKDFTEFSPPSTV